MTSRIATYVFTIALAVVLQALPAAAAERQRLHLFILSGQSNMAGLNPKISFTPAVEQAFADDEVIVVKNAHGGQPIRRWYRQWKPADGEVAEGNGDLYDRLTKAVSDDLGEKQPDTVTFVWMQGERDAREKHGEVYGASFEGLLGQLRSDLKFENLNFVIGRLSDFDNDNKRYPHWTKVREAQVSVADSSQRGSWVDTDDLNGPNNGLHYTKDGYKTLGQRFADKAIALIRESAN